MINVTHFRQLFPYYLSFLFRYAFSIVGILGILYFNIKGFTFQSIALYYSITSLSSLFFELPTSIFADKYGRKRSVVVGLIGEAIILALYPFATTNLFLWSLGFFSGFFATFSSGSETSLIVDNLKKKQLIEEYYVTRSTLFKFTGAISGLLGFFYFLYFTIEQRIGIFIAIDYLWFIYSAAVLIAVIIFCAKVEEKPFKRSKETSCTFIWKGLKHIVHHHNLRLIFFWIFIFMIAFHTWFFLYLPYLDSFDISFKTISLAYVLLSLVGLPFAKIGQTIYKRIKSKRNFLLTSYSIYFGWSLLVLISSKLFAYIYWFVRWNLPSFFKPLESAFQEEYIPKQRRSTINSVQTLVNQAAFVIGPLIGGYLLSITTPTNAIFFSSFLLIPSLVIISFLGK